MSLSALFFQLGLSVVFIALAAIGILWAIKSGQYDDLDGPAQRILMDEDDPMIPFNHSKPTRPAIEPDQTKTK
ncbi:MAG: cbb3-type cytochrome oxidase assembly protein CcoS [Methylophilaceae bacterium]|nr:cbb3-type cytochrome oxidase assembly protein CcoS [Methylophilaceae bacterium]